MPIAEKFFILPNEELINLFQRLLSFWQLTVKIPGLGLSVCNCVVMQIQTLSNSIIDMVLVMLILLLIMGLDTYVQSPGGNALLGNDNTAARLKTFKQCFSCFCCW